jgi:oxygen-dependent protoporphyrinogen oxidase
VLGIPTRVGPFVRTKLFTWRGKLRMGAELFVPRRTDGADESIGSFMRRRFGREATDFLAEPLLAGIHAGDVNRLSLHALFPRFAEAERTHGSLLRAFRANARLKPRAPSSGPVEREASAERNEGAFKSLPGGLSEMIRALVRIIGDANVRTGTKVTGVTGPGPFTVRTAGAASYHARAVVLATPAYVTADILKDRDAEVARRCRDIPYASAVTVALAFRRDAVAHPLNGSGFVVPRSEKNGILAASWLSSKWPGRAPEGRVLMRTFLGGARDPWAIDESDAECVERSMDALRPLLGISGEPLFTARLPLGPRQRAARSRSPRARRGHRCRARPPSWSLPHRQRLSWRRYPGLHRGWPEDSGPGRRLAEETRHGDRDDRDSTELAVKALGVFLALLGMAAANAVAQSPEISKLLSQIKGRRQRAARRL